MRRVIIFALLGPPHGMLTGFFVLVPLVSALAGDQLQFDRDQLTSLGALLPITYMVGLAPAVLVGIFDGILAKRNIGWRVLWCGLLGFTVSFLPLLTSLSTGFLHGPFVLMFGVIGAIPGGVCSWITGKDGSARDRSIT